MNSAAAPSTVQPEQLHQLVEGNTAFAFDLYTKLERTPGNIFFSPFSVSSCLAMAYAGARAQTESQMAKVLHFGKDQAQFHSAFGALQQQLIEAEQRSGVQLNLANALWAQQGHPFLPDFLNIAKTDYSANVNRADFRTSANAATREINHWVSQQTKDKIQNIVPAGSLDAQTKLVLANAIYFKGMWTRTFEKAQTSTQPFHLLDGGKVDMPLMHQVEEVRYFETGDFQTVELTYSTNELAMVVLLPRQNDGCHQLENQLEPNFLSKLLTEMKKQKVEIFLPRFKVESSFDLKESLVSLGLTDPFGPKADFSGMDGSHFLSLSVIFHKAWGEVNEEGTEAAAATVAGIRATAVMKPVAPPPVFRADHPFLFFIRDTHSGTLLFLGRMENPVKG